MIYGNYDNGWLRTPEPEPDEEEYDNDEEELTVQD